MEINTCTSIIDSIKTSYYVIHPFTESSLMSNLNRIEQSKRSDKVVRYNSFYKDYILDDGVIDSTIIHCQYLIEIEKELRNLTPFQIQYPSNTKFAALIYSKNNKIDTICIDEHFIKGLHFNNLYVSNNKLIYLLKKYSGFYTWAPKVELKNMPELNDTTFTRDSIKITLENNPNAIFEKRK